MDLHFDLSLTKNYKSNSQIARVLTEEWVARNLYCPVCGQVAIRHATANAPVKDFFCEKCQSQYELKSKKIDSSNFSTTIPDGEYRTMMERINALDNPSFLFLHYNRYEVNNLIIVPKCFFVPQIIIKRPPLPTTARRCGWEGCNIQLGEIPNFAKIPIIKDGVPEPIERVVASYNKIYTLQTKNVEARSWQFDILLCIEKLEQNFTLNDMYKFSEILKNKHTANNHIHDKIRQQLQVLRDKGIIEFKGGGHYRKLV